MIWKGKGRLGKKKGISGNKGNQEGYWREDMIKKHYMAVEVGQ